MATIRVEVEPDHLEQLAKVRKPLLAIEELIWNGLDADADRVVVRFDRNVMEGIERIEVSDTGHGMAHREAVSAFRSLGGSWKRQSNRSKELRRLLHGKAGKGRFRAFALGEKVTWRTVYQQDGQLMTYEIVGRRENLREFAVEDPAPATSGQPGTTVTIEGLTSRFGSLTDSEAIPKLTRTFALYLQNYHTIVVEYNGSSIRPHDEQSRLDEFELPPATLNDGSSAPVKLVVIEWKAPMDRALVLCDEDGFALVEVTPKFQAPGFHFTAYVKSAALREFDAEGRLEAEDLDEDVRQVLQAARAKLREHFRSRAAQTAAEVVAEWKRDQVYPFDDRPQTPVDEAARQVFDICALSINTYSPTFSQADTSAKRFQMRLLKEALSDSPVRVIRIVREVLDLPEEKQQELAELLERTTLSAVVTAAKAVADRLDFLQGLEALAYDRDIRPTVLERRQLHRILASETWVFGEEFNLTVDDQSLTAVLQAHVDKLGRDDLEPVTRMDGSIGIVDLMLSRMAKQSNPERREHLVVELKRPARELNDDDLNQIRSYALAVIEDPRFRNTTTSWAFWLVSSEMSRSVQRQVAKPNLPPGMLEEYENERIWVRTWGQILEDCRARLTFFQERLDYQATEEGGLDYLRAVHSQYLPAPLHADDCLPVGNAGPRRVDTNNHVRDAASASPQPGDRA